MENGFLVLDEIDWDKATPEQRDWMIFKTLKSMDRRLLKLEKKSFFDKGCAAIGGVVGGAGAALGLKWWGN